MINLRGGSSGGERKEKGKRKRRGRLTHLAKLLLRLGAARGQDGAGCEERARPAAGTRCGEGGRVGQRTRGGRRVRRGDDILCGVRTIQVRVLFLGTNKKAWVLWSTHCCCGGEHGAGRTCGKRCGMQSTSRQRRATELRAGEQGRAVVVSAFGCEAKCVERAKPKREGNNVNIFPRVWFSWTGGA
jgi:hypothetical protein